MVAIENQNGFARPANSQESASAGSPGRFLTPIERTAYPLQHICIDPGRSNPTASVFFDPDLNEQAAPMDA